LAHDYQGTELNSPNDVIVSSHGTIYLSDPIYGRTAGFGVLRPPAFGYQGLYAIEPVGRPHPPSRDFAQPNGLCLSPDESILYVNDTERMHIRSFTVAANGALAGGEVWAETVGDEPGAPDGMKIDSYGNVWCTGPGGDPRLLPRRVSARGASGLRIRGQFRLGRP
jgi:gluconolactonase